MLFRLTQNEFYNYHVYIYVVFVYSHKLLGLLSECLHVHVLSKKIIIMCYVLFDCMKHTRQNFSKLFFKRTTALKVLSNVTCTR